MTTQPRFDVRAVVRQTLTRAGYVQSHPDIPGPDDPIEWIEAEFYIPELSGPIVLQDYQRAVLREAYRRDEAGDYVYSVVVWSDIKKSAKSTIAAAVALERTRKLKWGRIRIIANDLKQADSRVGEALRRAITLNPRLSSRITVKANKVKAPNYCVIEAVPIDPKGEAGGGDDFVVFSELWGADSKAAADMWAESTLSPLKMGQSQRWIESYAGFSGESETLEQLYETGVKQGRRIDEQIGAPGLEIYANDAAKMLCLWNTVPRCTWQLGAKGAAYYAQETAVLTPEQFARMHRNQWQSSTQQFVPDAWIDACGVDVLPPIDSYKQVAVGIDAAISNDSFGIVAVSREGDKLIERFSQEWKPAPGEKLLYSNPNDPTDRAFPEGVLRWLAEEFNVVIFGYDIYQLHWLCSTLQADGVGYFEAFGQGAPRLESDKLFFDLIRERRFIHNKSLALVKHIKNANRKEDAESRKLRIVKRADALKIDLAICAATACYLGLQYLPE